MSANVDFCVVADAETLAVNAAMRIVAQLRINSGRSAICLTGGTGPQRLYEMLGSEPYSTQIPWDRVHWFIGDDRFVAITDPLSNMGAARRLFLDRHAPSINIHAIPTDVEDPKTAAQLYDNELRTFYGADRLTYEHPLFDTVLMGVGPDGHTASLFPGASSLDETDRWVVGVTKANVEPFIPRITLTFPALASCREMLFLVSGANKRAVVSEIAAGMMLPAARARSNNTTTWLVDASAAGRAI